MGSVYATLPQTIIISAESENMIPGLSTREFWMLVLMLVVAVLASVANYYLTKWGMNGGKPMVPLWKYRKPILFGALAAIILWSITGSGDHTPFTQQPLSHESAIMWAIGFGASSEKVVALVINKMDNKVAGMLGKL